MNKRIVRITALIAMFFVSVTLAAVFAFVKPAGAQAEASGATAWGTEIDECAYGKDCWSASETLEFVEDSGATANGFEKSYVKTLSAGTEILGQFSHASIKAEYTEVRFAIKTVNGKFRLEDFSASAAVWPEAYDGWTYFVLTRADAGWKIKVYFGDELVLETVNANGGDYVCSILWHKTNIGMGIYPDDSSKEMTVYYTEVRAATITPFSMVEGASLRIDDEEGGIRFRAKMNEKTATSVKDGSAAMNFVIAPKALFDTVTDGNYANLTKKIEIPVDGTKIYKDGDYYYANGVIANILEANRSLDFCATAYITANGTTTYAEADFSLTRGNLYDIVNQLVVLYGEEYAESILAAAPYEWYGKGDYPIVIDTVEQYNALAAQVNGGRDFSAYLAKIAGAVKSATDKTEISKPEFFPQTAGLKGELVAEKLFAEATESTKTAPEGYEKFYTYTAADGKTPFESIDITSYSKVFFEFELTNWAQFAYPAEAIFYSTGEGKTTKVLLTKKSGSWEITFTGENVLNSDSEYVSEITITRSGNDIKTLFTDMFCASGAVFTVTELRGEFAEKVLEGELVAKKLFAEATESTKTAPEGYDKFYTYTAADGKTPFESIDITSYSKVFFEFELANWAQFAYPAEAIFYSTGEGKTVKVLLIRKSALTWEITFTGEKVLNSANEYVSEITITRSGNDVKTLFTDMFCASGAVFTVTELRGEKATGYDTSAYTDKIMECAGTYDSSSNNGFEATTEITAPSGFVNVFKSVSCTTFDYGHNQTIDGYVKVCFASRTDGKYKHSVEGEIDGNGQWVYFELSRETASSNDWTIRIIDEYANVLLEVQKTSSFDSVCMVLWHGSPDLQVTDSTYVYCTELLGEPEDRYNNNSSKYTESHDFARTATQNYLVKDGATEYTVVIPSNPDTYIDYAKSELVSFFLEATGIELNVLTGADTAHTPSGKYISLGETRLFATSGLSVDKTLLGRDGVRILTKDLSVYITGGSERGVLYGVYDFLKMNFGYEVYAKDCYTIDTGVTELPLYDYDVTDIPDISLRVRAGMAFNLTEENDDVMFASRMRTLDDYNYLLLPIYEEFDNENSEWSRYHNGFHYLPKSEYETAHPEFYSDDGTQLCYTAHGNSESFELMTDLCAKKAEQSLTWWLPERFPEMNTVHIGVQDVRTACDCSSCKAFKASHNDSNAAAILKFVNRMGEKVVAWMNKEENAAYKRENLTFSFFVYQETLTPPFTVNADGTVNIAEDLVSPEGVTVRPYTAFSDLIYFKSVDDEANAEELKKVEQWSAYVKDGWAWTYGCFFNDYFCFYDFYPFYKDYFGKIYDLGYGYAFPQFHSEQRGADTGFYTLANYLTSKLSWNSSLDADELIADYFDKAYGPAAKKMREFYDECRSWFAKTAASQEWNAESINARVTTDSACFAYADVQKFFGLLDEAYAAIESLKTTDSARYETLKSHIDLEWLFPAKVALTLYQGNYDSATLSAMKTKFKSLCEGFGMTKIGESESIDEFINSL